MHRPWRGWLSGIAALGLALAGCTTMPFGAAATTTPTATVAATSAAARVAVTATALPPSPLATPTTTATPTAADCSPAVRLVGFSDALDKTRFAGFNVGGLSALAPGDATDTYVALSDNEGLTPARWFVIEVPVTNGVLGAPTVMAAQTLSAANGANYTGANFDGEGLAIDARGDRIITSEVEPSVRIFGQDGRQKALLPVPDRYQVAPLGQASLNATFEGLTLAPDGSTLLVGMEGPLDDDGWTADRRPRLRIVRYERGPAGWVPTGFYPYAAEPGQSVSEIAFFDQSTLLVLERGYLPTFGNTIRIFQVDLAAAARPLPDGPLPASAPFLTKRLLADLARCPSTGAKAAGPQPSPLLDNYEGMAVGPPLAGGARLVVLVSDDNFSHTQVTRLLVLLMQPLPRTTD